MKDSHRYHNKYPPHLVFVIIRILSCLERAKTLTYIPKM